MTTDLSSHDFDGFWKAALDLYVRPLVAFVAPDVHDSVNWEAGVETLDKEFLPASPDSVTGRLFVDKLVRVRMLTGDNRVLLIHVEIQGERDDAFERRMFAYWCRIYERYAEPVFSIAVLADDDPRWRPTAFEVVVSTTRLRFEFARVKLLDLEPRLDEMLASANPFAWLVAIDVRTRRTRRQFEVRLHDKTRMARTLLLEPRLNRKDKRALYRLLTSLMQLPENLEQKFDAEMRTVEGPAVLILSPMELRAIAKGRVEEARDLVIRAVIKRFGEAGAGDESVRAALAHISDAAVLDELFDAAVLAPSRAEFDAVLARVIGA